MTYYPEGAGINWHKYAGALAERIVGAWVGAP